MIASPGTALPWEWREKARSQSIFGDAGRSYIAPFGAEDPFGADAIARCYTMDGLNERHDNARYIVTACNAYPDLVEALKLADAALRGANMNMAAVESKIAAALAKAGAA